MPPGYVAGERDVTHRAVRALRKSRKAFFFQKRVTHHNDFSLGFMGRSTDTEHNKYYIIKLLGTSEDSRNIIRNGAEVKNICGGASTFAN